MKTLIVLLNLILVSCADLPISQNTQIGAGSALTGVAVNKVIEDIKDRSEFVPYFIFPNLEVCYKSDNFKFKCLLLNCDGEVCEREVLKEVVLASLENEKSVIVSLKAWASLIASLETYIEENPEAVKRLFSDYNNIEKIFLVEGEG